MFAMVVMCLAGAAWAGKTTEINAAQLKAKLDAKAPFTLADSLSPIEFAAGHIPGSINIPFEQMKSSKLLPQDKSRLLVFYCMGRK
jgi:rhodanese-related sulfurtransferase